MNDFTIWVIGVGAITAVVLAAAAAYAWYTYLERRLPPAVKFTALESRILELEEQCADLQQQKNEHTEDVKQLLLKKQELDLEIGELKAWKEKNEEKLLQLPLMREEINRIEGELEEKKGILERLQEELLQAQAQRLEEEEKAAMARSELKSVEKEVADLEGRKDRFDVDVRNLEEKAQALQTNLGKLEIEHRSAEDKLSRRQTEVARAEKELEALKGELKTARADLKEARKRSDLKDEILAVTTEQIEVKKKLLESLANEAQALTERIKTINPPPPKAAERLEDLTRPVLGLDGVGKDPRKKRGDDGEEDCFKGFAKYVGDAGFDFDHRVLRAFHTSLKIADISPLVVLAGISGTGKSQLPRLYAEAMGIHFLNVSVQPRWDAPQDLFGFYNYMEHRYKATELSRALRQMDSYNWPWNQEEDKESQTLQEQIQKGMLLVLLDEMNLARVEYYFSELLSKLEMRDRERTNDPDSRRLSEIEIEMGSLEASDDPRRLFVGYNVLFTGTMNEDETTQSLSDKVIDRANVLRFGKPGETTGDPVGEKERQASSGFLSHSDWGSWLKSVLPDDEQQRLDKACERMNLALAGIYRPFGFRVHQAMQRYIANYPRWRYDGGGDWFNHALADQLEQKIIPKLRGVSRDEDKKADAALEEIKGVVEETHDDNLIEAFDSACERPIFQWAGVNRQSAHEDPE